jgi:2,3-dihydroxybiphenyl 1,2-dioxygenase
MTHELRLGYLVFGTARVSRWSDFCGRMLGLPAPVPNSDASLGWRIDGAAQRLIVEENPVEDLQALGLECAGVQSLQRAVERLKGAGHPVEEAPTALLHARRVQHLWTTSDPAGNRVELYCGMQEADGPFRSDAFPGGFRTGELGLGHAVLVSHDLVAMEAFYACLGFGVTERLSTRVGPIDIRGIFLHCNRRHHSLALFDLPSPTRLHHFMLQANQHMDVGRALERAKACGVPLSLDIGQHPAPDATFSFYGATPSGFDFEIGAGSGEIDPATWGTMKTSVTSSWGHRPQWRLKLRMAGALVAHKLGRGLTRQQRRASGSSRV